MSYSGSAELISLLTFTETHIPLRGVCRKVHENIRRVRAGLPMDPSYANEAIAILWEWVFRFLVRVFNKGVVISFEHSDMI